MQKSIVRKLACPKKLKIQNTSLQQKVPISFSHSKKLRAVYEIVKELSLLMDHGKGSTAAMLEIGSHNTHGFKLEDGYHAWFDGIVQAFNPTSIKHEII